MSDPTTQLEDLQKELGFFQRDVAERLGKMENEISHLATREDYAAGITELRAAIEHTADKTDIETCRSKLEKSIDAVGASAKVELASIKTLSRVLIATFAAMFASLVALVTVTIQVQRTLGQIERDRESASTALPAVESGLLADASAEAHTSTPALPRP
jgi:hypothetical protein